MNTFNEFELNRIKKFYSDELTNRLLQRSKSSRRLTGARPSSGAAVAPSIGGRSSSSVSSSSSISLSPPAVAPTTGRPDSRQSAGLARSSDRLHGSASPGAAAAAAGVDLKRYQRAFLTKRAPAATATSVGAAGSNLQQLRKSVARFGRTLFDFQAKNERELSLKRGDLVEMLELIDHNWARVEDCQSGLQGLVPLSYIDYSVGCAVARRDVSGQQQVSRSCPQEAPLLPMSKGEPITLIRRLSGHWYEASNTRQANGLVWSNDLDIIKQPVLVQSSSSQPLTDDQDEDEEMLILETGERVLASGRQMRAQPRRAKSTQPDHRACQCGACLGSSPIGASHQQKPDANYCCQPRDSAFRTLQNCPTGQLRQPRRSSSSPYISSSANLQQQLPRLCRAKFAYKPRQKDELELIVGDILMVVHQCDDGWFIGTSYSSKETGTFPGNFVEPIS